jgi:O-Antigen ligase
MLVLGCTLLLAAIGWEWLAGNVDGTDSARQVELLTATGGAFAVGRGLGWMWRPLVPAVVAFGTFAAAYSAHGALSGRPLAGPLGYGNADAAFYVQGVAAALVLIATSRLISKVFWLAVGVGLFAAILATKSQAGFAFAVVVTVVAGLALVAPRCTRVVGVAMALALLAAAGVTAALGVDFGYARSPGPLLHDAERVLTVQRVQLWHDSMVIVRHHPGLGVGPGQFARTSPTALHDTDFRWAHSEPLQQAAETGVVGGLLFLSLPLWGLAELGRSGSRARTIGAAAVGALALHSCMDYVLHYPAAPITAAVLLGSVSSPTRSRWALRRAARHRIGESPG